MDKSAHSINGFLGSVRVSVQARDAAEAVVWATRREFRGSTPGVAGRHDLDVHVGARG